MVFLRIAAHRGNFALEPIRTSSHMLFCTFCEFCIPETTKGLIIVDART